MGKGTLPTIQRHINQLVKNNNADLLSTQAPDHEMTSAPTQEVQRPLRVKVSVPIVQPELPIAITVAPTQVETKPEFKTSETPLQPRPERTFQVKKAIPRQNQGQNGQSHTQGSGQNGHQNNHHHNQNQNQHQNRHQNKHNEPPYSHDAHQQNFDYEVAPEAPLESLSKEQLLIRFKRLDSSLMKEQSRRETAERIALETKDYADKIKEQVAQRINDLRQNMDLVVEQLKSELREQKQAFGEDLKFYQEQLNKANHHLMREHQEGKTNL